MIGVPFAEATDESRFGGKTASLGRAIAAGLPVPEGHGLDAATVEEIVTNQGSARDQIDDLFALHAPTVAVRSSAIGEDSLDASFAGQHDTILNVRSPALVIEAILEVHASAWAESAIAYREKLGIESDPTIAVAIQRQIDSEISGVLFTRNPVTGDEERLIEAAWGLGEAIVAGLIVPDRFRLDADGTIIERTPGDKDLKIIPDPSGGTIEVEVDADMATRLSLRDDQLTALHELTKRCEATYGPGLDLEWSFADERLYLLQCRSITSSS